MSPRWTFVLIVVALTFSLGTGLAQAPPPDSSSSALNANALIPAAELPQRAAAPDAPVIFHTESGTIASLTYSAGYLTWSHAAGCPGGEFAEPCVIAIKGEGSETSFTYSMVLPAAGAIIRSNLAADVDGNVYWQDGSGKVVRHGRYGGTGAPAEQVALKETPGASGQVAIDENYVFWTENNSGAGTGKLFRAPKTGGARQLLAESPDSVIAELQADGLGGALFIADTCGGICLPAVLQRVTPNGGGFTRSYGFAAVQTYAHDGANVYYAADAGPDGLHLGQAPLTDVSSYTQIQDLPDKPDDSDFVKEIVLLNDALYYHVGGTGGGPLFRRPLPAGSPVPLTENWIVLKDLVAGERFLFWFDADSIFKLAPDTAAYQADLSLTGIELTQGIQNLANDVPLIQDKSTHVRVYPAVAGSVGAEVVAKITLHGERGGSPLPGSPLTPRFVTVKSAGNLRQNLEDSANWVLPPTWLQGALTLRAEISNPHFFDPNSADNSLTLSRSFTPKTNICIKFVPIQTWQSLPYWTRSPLSGATTPGFLEIVNRFDTLWGARQTLWYTQYIPLRKPQFLGEPRPFNMNGGADRDHLIAALYEHNVWDSAPDWCGGDNARTHYVAMVHPAINTTRMNADGSSTTTTGFASFGEPLSWVKMLPDSGGADFATPRGGTTMAQEIGHNYNDLLSSGDRWKHVNCGLPAGDDPHDAYPYNTSTIGPVGPDTYWGFDRRTNAIIQPDQARDYMSYCDPVWTSDYNWRGSQNATQNLPTTAAVEGLTPAAAPSAPGLSLRGLLASLSASFRARLAPTADTLLLYGLVSQDETSAEFPIAYRLNAPLATALAADLPPEGVAFLGDSGHGSGPHGDFDPLTGAYTLEFLSASGAVLSSTPIVPTQGTHGGQYAFLANLPYPDGTAAVRLNKNGAEMIRQTASSNPPTVDVFLPAGGENIGGALNIAWSANDADGDPLTFVVQYSADDGATWRVLASQLSESELTVEDTSNLPGSATARIRVIANDGLNMGLGTSAAFSLGNHSPQALVDAPPGVFSVSEPAVLDGLGLDPEEGELPSAALDWAVSGPSAHSAGGAQLSLSGLAPGSYTATLTAADSAGALGTGAQTFQVATKRIFDAAEAPALDGFCDDPAYAADSQPVFLAYPSGETAGVWMTHANNRLFVCINGMPQLGSGSEAVGLFVDPDNSGGAVIAPTDKGFYLRRDGQAQTASGNGSGGVVTDPTAPGLLGAVSESTGLWSAELRIDVSALGGWDKLARLVFAHNAVAFWPAAAGVNPDSWGETAFGQQTQTITFPQPPAADLYAGLTVVAAQASSGLPVELESTTPAVCVAAGKTVVLLAAGECRLSATQPGDAAYAAAPPVTRMFAVVDNQPKVYLPAIVR